MFRHPAQRHTGPHARIPAVFSVVCCLAAGLIGGPAAAAGIEGFTEPYREIDNWINNFTKHDEAFAKPKVRDALVQELTARGGLESDLRFFEDPAYAGPTPSGLGVSERHFYLLAALSVEYFQEIYELEPETKQLLHFRDYFVSTFRYLSR